MTYIETFLKSKNVEGYSYLRGKVTRNINTIFANLSEDEINSHKNWYLEAFKYCVEESLKYDLNHLQVAAILAKLSPTLSWEDNKLGLERLMLQNGAYRGFGENVDYAKAIAAGEFGDTIESLSQAFSDTSFKTYTFFRNLIDPMNRDYVTIDRWMIRILANQEYGWITPNRYAVLAQAIKKKANDFNLLPNQLQSVLWEVAKKDCKK